MGIEREGMNLKFVGGNSDDEQSTGGASKFRKKSTETHCSSFFTWSSLTAAVAPRSASTYFLCPLYSRLAPFYISCRGKIR